MPIEDASVKIRVGGARDDKADLALPHWAGVVPLALQPQRPRPETECRDAPLPASVQRLLDAPSERMP